MFRKIRIAYRFRSSFITLAPSLMARQFSRQQSKARPKGDTHSRNSFVVIGLGNHGREYEGTRHNIGADCVSLLCSRFGKALTDFNENGSQGRPKFFQYSSFSFAEVLIDPTKEPKQKKMEEKKEKALEASHVYFVKLHTFMNLSGPVVREVLDTLSVSDKNLILIYDEADLPVGSIKVRRGKSEQGRLAGSHNGLNSVVKHLGESSPFIRVKVGIDRGGGVELAEHVLSKFSMAERERVKRTQERVAECVLCLVREGVDKSMSRYNLSWEQFLKAEEVQLQREQKKRLWLEKQQQQQQQPSSLSTSTPTEEEGHVPTVPLSRTREVDEECHDRKRAKKS